MQETLKALEPAKKLRKIMLAKQHRMGNELKKYKLR
jgi:hypothetical protein